MNLIFPYSFLYVFIFLLGIIPPLPQISGYTHWIVTQHGMIEPIATSYYHLRQSWNLVQLVHQERNYQFIQRIELKLNKVSNDLHVNQQYQNKVQRHYVDADSRCVRASKLLSESDLQSTHVLTLEAKGVRSERYLNADAVLRPDNAAEPLRQPICESIFERDFSMCCYEHLQAIRNRSASVVSAAELSLYKLVVPSGLSVDQYGHLVAVALVDGGGHSDAARNWVLYNMAAFYWRIRGAAARSIECLRAALHTSPREQQDIALVSLANVLQQRSRDNAGVADSGLDDALVLMHNALAVSPHFASHHLILGNIYASLGRFRESVAHYTLAGRLHSLAVDRMPLREIEERIFAARCSLELSEAIGEQQRQLDQQFEELEAFQHETNRFQDAKTALNDAMELAADQRQRQRLYDAVLLEQDELDRQRMAAVSNRCVVTDPGTGQELPCDPAMERWAHNASMSMAPVSASPPPPWTTSTISHGLPVNLHLYPKLSIRLHTLKSHKEIQESICKFVKCANIHQKPQQDPHNTPQKPQNLQQDPHNTPQKPQNLQQDPHNTPQNLQQDLQDPRNHQKIPQNLHENPPKPYNTPQNPHQNGQKPQNLQQDLQDPQNHHKNPQDLHENPKKPHNTPQKPHNTPQNQQQRINPQRSHQFLSIYLSPTNKGFDTKGLLTDRQGLGANREHPLPWHPPNCLLYVNKTDLMPVDIVDQLHLQQSSTTGQHRPPSNELRHRLLEDEDDTFQRLGALDDIGQRIVTAIERRLMPQWILFNVAGLYWRVVGDLLQALQCHRLAVKLSPVEFRDVSLVNLAVVLATIRENADALKLTEAALQIDYSEPETHTIAAGLYGERERFDLAHHHLTIAMKQDSRLASAFLDEMETIKCRLCRKYQHANHSRHSIKKNRALRHNVTQIFVNYKMCSSTAECSNIIGKNYQFLPHIKVTIKGPTFSPSDIEKLITIDMESVHKEVSSPKVMYGILWNTNLSNLHIQEHECLLANDSSRSVGCHHNDEIFTASQNAINFLSDLRALIERITEPVVDNIPTKWSDDKHVCHNDRPKPVLQDEVSPPTLKLNTNDIQESIVSMVSPRVVLNPLAPEDCEKVAPFDFKTYTPLYVSLNTMRINVIALLDSLAPGYLFTFNQHPYCVPTGNNFLRQIIEKYQVDFESSPHSKVPEYNLHASFLKTFDDKYSLEDIGKRLYTGIEQNTTDWRLATIVVNYWRVSGDARQAFNCLELAMENSPEFHEKVILVNAANILYRINKLEAALEIAHKALQYPDSQNWIVIPFLVANIFARMDQWHKATLFYEICLSLKADFEEAIYRIKSIQCQQMVLQNLEQH